MSSIVFVGRQTQQAELNSHWREAVHKRQGKVVFLTGEAGIGKTSLIRHFSHDVQVHYSRVQVAYAQCDQIAGDISPYAPFVQVLNNLLEQAAAQGDNWFVEYMQQVGPDVLDMVPVAGKLLAAVAKSVGFIWERRQEKAEALDRFGQHVRFQQFTDAFCNLARNQNPLLLCIDDWHWADTSSTNLLFHIARSLDQVPLMIIATYRPEDARARNHPILNVHTQTKRYKLCIELELDFLSRIDIEHYLTGRFPQASFEPAFIDQLVNITSGNALFVTEFINLLVYEELLTAAGQLKGDLQQLALPPSVEAVIQSRISHLNQTEQSMLAYASVEGEQFTVFLLSKLLEMDPVAVLADLNRITARYQLIADLGEQVVYQQKTTVYRFNHTLIRRALSATFGQQGQVEISRRITRLLGDIYNRANRASQGRLAPDLIQHAANARDYASQVRFALIAAREAVTNYAHSEVIKYCQLILTVVDREALPSSRKVPAHYYLGHTYRQLGRYDQAVACYTEVISIHPDYNQAYQHRGRTYFNWKKYDLALADYDRALELDPTSATSFFMRATICRRLNQEAEALADFARALELDPDNHAFYRDRGRIYAGQKRLKKAIQDYNKALALRPGSVLTYMLRANVYRQLEQYDQAIADFTAAISLEPDYYLAYRDRGRVYFALKAYREAVADYSRAIALRPNRAFSFVLRGIAYCDLADHSAAKADFTRALEIKPEYYPAILERGQTYLLQQDCKQALADFDQAIDLKPGRPRGFLGRGDAHRCLGQFSAARTDYRRALKLATNPLLQAEIMDRLEQMGH